MRSPRPSGLFAVLAAVVVATSADAQELVLGMPVSGEAAYPVAAAGDFDGDGRADILIGEPEVTPPPYTASHAGRITVRSSATGAVLLEVDGTVPWAGLGRAVSDAADQDGDGVPDLLVADWFAFHVRLLSGVDGSTLHSIDDADNQFEVSLARLGDVDGDGLDEFVVGTPWDASLGIPAGVVRIYAGGTWAIRHVITSGGSDGKFGYDVAAVDDLDGDGAPDLLVGSTRYGEPAYVSVYSGRTGVELYTLLIPGNSTADSISVDDAGDVDGDGVHDVVFGEHNLTGGKVMVHSGRTGARLLTLVAPAANGSFGGEVAGVGDLDLDGHDDIAVSNNGSGIGGPTSPDRILLFSGADGSVLAGVKHPGPYFADGLGNRMARLGDVTGDGLPDLLAASRHVAQVVSCRIEPNPKPELTWSASVPLALAPYNPALAAAGDVDGDGREDVVVGAPFDETSGPSSGAARVYSGDGAHLLLEVFGDDPSQQFGRSVAFAGDVDGDGRSDLLVGAPGTVQGGLPVGAVFLLSGANGSILRAYHGEPVHWSGFGSSVTSLGDADGDGWPRIAVGAPFLELATSAPGAVYVIETFDGSLVYRKEGASNGALLGSALDCAGDVDGDGEQDVLAGSPGESVSGQGSGAVRIVSGAHGGDLLTVPGPYPSAAFGTMVVTLGDVDGDGTPDFLARDPIRVHSGRDGSVLRTHEGSKETSSLGTGMAGGGDCDGDGWPDYLLAAAYPVIGSQYQEPETIGGTVFVHSGSTGAILATLRQGAIGDGLGAAVCLADIDGDGLSDPVMVRVPIEQVEEPEAALLAYSIVRPWTSLPGALAGTGGAPSLSGNGTLTAGEAVEVRLTEAAPHRPGRLVLGLQVLLAPFKGGVLYAMPLVAPGFATDSAGSATWSGTWPSGLPPGQGIFLQAWLLDASGPQGCSASNALLATGH
jgi:hypothetical protein